MDKSTNAVAYAPGYYIRDILTTLNISYNDFAQKMDMNLDEVTQLILGECELNEEIAKILEFKSPYRVKYLLNDCYYYSEDDLIKYLSKLADIDKNIKSGNGDGKFLLELFIAKKDM